MDRILPPEIGLGVAVFASYFWAWAVQNVQVLGRPDLGILTFALAILAGLCVFFGVGKRKWVVWAWAAVSLNYLVGAFLGHKDQTFLVYCLVFCLGWAVLAYLAWRR